MEDFDGDRKADIAVYRASTGQWFIRGQEVVSHGTATDVPVPADYNGDGRAEIATFLSGQWRIRGGETITYGEAGDTPLAGDYAGDARAEIAVYRPSTGHWFIRTIAVVQHGEAGDIP